MKTNAYERLADALITAEKKLDEIDLTPVVKKEPIINVGGDDSVEGGEVVEVTSNDYDILVCDYNIMVDASELKVRRMNNILKKLFSEVKDTIKPEKPTAVGEEAGKGKYKQSFKCKCGGSLDYYFSFKFCPHCGKKIDWEKQ